MKITFPKAPNFVAVPTLGVYETVILRRITDRLESHYSTKGQVLGVCRGGALGLLSYL